MGICSPLEAGQDDCTQSPRGQAAWTPPLPTSHGAPRPTPAPAPGCSFKFCFLPGCQQFPLGTLRALGCQLSWHDASPVPGERGPHVPHMPPGWVVSTEQLSCPLLLLLPPTDFPASLPFSFLEGPPTADQGDKMGSFSVYRVCVLSKAWSAALVSVTYLQSLESNRCLASARVCRDR